MLSARVVILLLFAVCVTGKLDIPPEYKAILVATEKKCAIETQVDPDVLETAKRSDIQPDAKLKCFIKCMMVNLKTLNEDGTLNEQNVFDLIPESLKKQGALDYVHKCKNEKGVDVCDTAYKMVVCFWKDVPDIAEMFT